MAARDSDADIPPTNASGGLITVGRFPTPGEAHIARAMLDAHGLFAVVADDHHASINWIIIPALGGIRLHVLRRDRAEATALLHGGGETENGVTAEYEPLDRCPNCGSGQVMRPRSLLAGLLGLAGAGVPVFVATRRRACHDCGHRWRTGP
jgi:DNA-directed RNA polymerase subunit RPC12/RpoP